MADADKDIAWVGSSLVDLSNFPPAAKTIAGFQLRRVQKGLEPNHWKPISTVGAGVQEIIINIGDAFRVFYVAEFAEAIYVLHAFQKKTKKTSDADIELAKKRYKEVVEARKHAAKK